MYLKIKLATKTLKILPIRSLQNYTVFFFKQKHIFEIVVLELISVFRYKEISHYNA